MQTTKVIVKGKARSRIALGIVTAYLRLHPNTTLAALKDVFPDSICPKAAAPLRSITPLGVFQPLEVVQALPEQGLSAAHYTAEGELLNTADGVAIAVTKSWTPTAFNALTAAAAAYGIKAAVVDKATKWSTGVYELEFLEEEQPLEIQNVTQFPQAEAAEGREKKHAAPKNFRLKLFALSRKNSLLYVILMALIIAAITQLLRRSPSDNNDNDSYTADTIIVLQPSGDKPVVLQQGADETTGE